MLRNNVEDMEEVRKKGQIEKEWEGE